jgi:C4-dicarboxylate transporter DctQ subunit
MIGDEDEDIAQYQLPEGKFTLIVNAVASLCLGATVVITTMQVVLRYGFNSPQTWAEEVSRYLLAWIILLGAAIAVARGTHIRVDILETLVSGGRSRRALRFVQGGVELFAYAVLFYSGCLVVWEHRFSRFYTIIEAPQVIFYLAAPVGAALMIGYLIISARRGL